MDDSVQSDHDGGSYCSGDRRAQAILADVYDLAQRNAAKFIKNHLGEKDVGVVL